MSYLIGPQTKTNETTCCFDDVPVSFLGFGQGSVIQEFPFNPDSNGDDFVGVTDLQSFLASYGQSFGSPPPMGRPLQPLTSLRTGVRLVSFGLHAIKQACL